MCCVCTLLTIASNNTQCICEDIQTLFITFQLDHHSFTLSTFMILIVTWYNHMITWYNQSHNSMAAVIYFSGTLFHNLKSITPQSSITWIQGWKRLVLKVMENIDSQVTSLADIKWSVVPYWRQRNTIGQLDHPGEHIPSQIGRMEKNNTFL